MPTCRLIVLALLILAGWCCVSSSGTAQEAAGGDDLTGAVDKQDLDSYWLDQNMWAEYGYRPHVKAQVTPFVNLPTYGHSTGAYAYGTDLPTPSLQNPYDKTKIQLTKYGTWH